MKRRICLQIATMSAAWLWMAPAQSQSSGTQLQAAIDRYAATLPKGYGPHSVLQVQAALQNRRVILSGQALREQDRNALEQALAQFGSVENRVEVFPFASVGEKAYGVVRSPGADLRAKPQINSELVSQALLGDTLKVLAVADDERWFKVLREWDEYVGWMEAKHLVRWTPSEWQRWQDSPRVMLLDSQDGLSRGSILLQAGADPAAKINALTPTGQKYQFPADRVRPITSQDTAKRDEVMHYARLLLARQPTRYLWGGTTGNALDCSGFNQTVYRLAGGVLPRDSYQQQAFSRPVAMRLEDWQQLQPGDLLFFSESGKRATHTGIYVGEGNFIHSSGHNQGIAQNSLIGKSQYEQLLRKIYFGAGRVQLQ